MFITTPVQELAHVVAALAMQKVLSSTACDIIIDVFRTIRNKNSFNKTRSSRMNVARMSLCPFALVHLQFFSVHLQFFQFISVHRSSPGSLLSFFSVFSYFCHCVFLSQFVIVHMQFFLVHHSSWTASWCHLRPVEGESLQKVIKKNQRTTEYTSNRVLSASKASCCR